MFKVIAVFPSFFTYITFTLEVFASIMPHVKEESAWVQPLSEYTPTFIALIVPLLEIDLFPCKSASALAMNNIAATTTLAAAIAFCTAKRNTEPFSHRKI
jgi:hypothetical protein